MKFIEENIEEIEHSIMKRFYCVDKTAVEAFISFSDKDTRQVWNKKHRRYALEYKLKHVHVIRRFKKEAMLLNDIAAISGVTRNISTQTGQDSYNNYAFVFNP